MLYHAVGYRMQLRFVYIEQSIIITIMEPNKTNSSLISFYLPGDIPFSFFSLLFPSLPRPYILLQARFVTQLIYFQTEPFPWIFILLTHPLPLYSVIWFYIWCPRVLKLELLTEMKVLSFDDSFLFKKLAFFARICLPLILLTCKGFSFFCTDFTTQCLTNSICKLLNNLFLK